MKGGKFLLYAAYAVFGIYLINFSMSFYPLPEIVTGFDKAIIGVGGLLLLVSMINPFKKY